MVLRRDDQFSERCGCGLIGISRSSDGYQGRPDRHSRLRERLLALSARYRRYGARLRQEAFDVHVKVVERLYNEERLALRRCKCKKIPKVCVKGLVSCGCQSALVTGLHPLADGRSHSQPER